MSLQDCLIVESADGWHLLAGSQSERLASGASIDELVTCLGLMVKLTGLKEPSCVIAPASTSCFFTRMPAESELDIHDRNSLRFELESHLPLDAESMVADFVVTSGSTKPRATAPTQSPSTLAHQAEAEKSVAAVAIDFRRWKEIADAVEASGIAVRSIVPSALLAARAVCQMVELDSETELFLVNGSFCDAMTVSGNSVVAWKHLELDPAILKRHKLLDSPGINPTLVIGAEEEDQRNSFAVALPAAQIRHLDHALPHWWNEGARLAISKPSPRWFELRRDQLAPGDPLRAIAPQLRLVAIAAGLCLLAIALGGWWRSHRIDQTIQWLNEQQRAAFQTAFPDVPVPAALVRRVRSEHAKLSSSRGVSAEIEVPPAATEVLRHLMIALPAELRFHINSLQISSGRVDLKLQVRTAVDAGNLAMALKSHGFEVEPPVNTRSDANTFDSVLKARWMPASRTPSEAASNTDQRATEPAGASQPEEST